VDLGLAGKSAIVAGGSRGLGKATAMALAAEGANVAIAARDERTLRDTGDEIEAACGREVLAVPTDVTRESDVARLVEATLARFERIDVLVANAGGPPASEFETTDVSAWKSGIELSLLSVIYLCRAVVPIMKRQGSGRIVAIASISVKQPVEGLILSNTARAGVVGMMKTLSNELAPHDIGVNVVCPGYTRTGRLEELAARMSELEGVPLEAVRKRWTDQIPMARLGEPEELASVVAFLCSERASYVTGTCLQVDGGAVRSVF
jgi:3-oxoacyl-[acyl-carrier protein] reductase